jgi:hypothetical protein
MTDGKRSIAGMSRIANTSSQVQKKAADEGSPMEEVADVLQLTCQKDFNKSTSKMVDWMLQQQGLIPQGKNGRPSMNFILHSHCDLNLLASDVKN